jgi:signal peptidase II
MSDSSVAPRSSSFRALIVGITLLTVLLDQLSKQAILATFERGELLSIIPGFFNLTLTFNPGAAFGLWGSLPEGWRQAVLALTILFALVVVFFFLRQPGYQNRISQGALAGILGGALGNIIDRMVHGHVIDFLDFYIGQWHWPAFNLADSVICIGVFALIFVPERRAQKESAVSHP